MNLNEFLTRKQKIDVLLKEQGWTVGDRRSVIAEVDTKQSDFRSQNYKTVAETLRNDLVVELVDKTRYPASTTSVQELPVGTVVVCN